MDDQLDMVTEIQSGDMRRALIAIRDYLVHELSGHRCDRCSMSQLKTGDTASLVLRLQKVLEEIAALPDPNAAEDPLDKIIGDYDNVTKLGTKSAPRKQGGRRFTKTKDA